MGKFNKKQYQNDDFDFFDFEEDAYDNYTDDEPRDNAENCYDDGDDAYNRKAEYDACSFADEDEDSDKELDKKETDLDDEPSEVIVHKTAVEFVLDEYKDYPQLSQEQIAGLINEYRNTEDLDKREAVQTQITGSVIKLFVPVYKKYMRMTYDESELVSQCLESIVNSIRTYDESKGTAFSTYAYNNMEYAARNVVGEKNFAGVSLSCGESTKYRKIQRYVREYEQEFGVEPSNRQISFDLGYNLEDVKNLRGFKEAKAIDPLIEYGDDEEQENREGLFKDENAEDCFRDVESQDLKHLVAKVLARRSPLEREIFDRVVIDGQNFATIGRQLGIKWKEAERIYNEVMADLRACIPNSYGYEAE